MTNKLTKEQEKRKYIFKSVTDSLPLWLIRDSKVMYRDGYVYVGDITETVADEIARAREEGYLEGKNEKMTYMRAKRANRMLGKSSINCFERRLKELNNEPNK